MSALFAYRRYVVSQHRDGTDKTSTLETIDELMDTALDVVYTRMSESAGILHRLKHNLPRSLGQDS
ncbi:hypothetical protein GO730_00310 [Spirosoma sp. HMF3257]|nr:hypothetical protein [Spirosoma telluris]